MVQEIVTIIVDGLVYSSYLFMVAVGLTVIFGVMKILNVTHGSFYAFGAYLAATGYENPLFAVQAWSSEIAMVTAAAEAHDRSASLRPIAEIEAELKTLPTVPLDDEGIEERRRLLEELELAAIPQQERDTAGAASARLAKLRAQAGLEDLQ